MSPPINTFAKFHLQFFSNAELLTHHLKKQRPGKARIIRSQVNELGFIFNCGLVQLQSLML